MKELEQLNKTLQQIRIELVISNLPVEKRALQRDYFRLVSLREFFYNSYKETQDKKMLEMYESYANRCVELIEQGVEVV